MPHPNRDEVSVLLQNPIIKRWISDYRLDNKWEGFLEENPFPDCIRCGWPHNKSRCCGMGATFGRVTLGGYTYYIDASNVRFMLKFISHLNNGYHWRNETFFDVVGNDVVVTYLEPYNNCPQVKTWRIPSQEWESIVEFVDRKQSRTKTAPELHHAELKHGS